MRTPRDHLEQLRLGPRMVHRQARTLAVTKAHDGLVMRAGHEVLNALLTGGFRRARGDNASELLNKYIQVTEISASVCNVDHCMARDIPVNAGYLRCK